MDTDSEDIGQGVLRDSGFFEDTPPIDEAESFKSQASATSSPPNASSTTSAPHDVDLDASRNMVLLDLWEQVPEVELGWFLERLLPKLHKDIKFNDTLRKLNGDSAAVVNDRWAMFKQCPLRSDTDNENIVFSPFPKLADKICQAAGMSGTKKTVHFKCIPDKTPSQTMRPNSSRPDAAAMLEEPEKGPTNYSDDIRWIDVVAPGEFKKNPKDADENHKQVLWQMAYIMRENPRRRFVHGFTIEDTEMRLWFCSRSDVIVSKPFDFMKDRSSTVRFILSITYGTPTELGFDERIRRLPDGQFDIDVSDGQGGVKTYRTVKLLSNIGADALQGRGTRVWLVNPLSRIGRPDPNTEYVLKDCWIDSDRTSEGRLMESVLETAAPNLKLPLERILLHTVNHGRVHAGKVEDHTHHVMFRGQPLPELLDTLDVRVSAVHAKTNVASNLRVQGAMAPEKAEKKVPPRYSGKVHYRIVYREVGKTLRDVESMSEVFEHLSNVIRGVSLLDSCGWIHRDISVGNILVVENKHQQPDQSHKVEKQIKISDIEYAQRLDNDQPPHGIRTGTIYFMSTEVESHMYQYWKRDLIEMEDSDAEDEDWRINPRTPPRAGTKKKPRAYKPPFRHNVLHDGESVFWLALYLILMCVLARRTEEGVLAAHRADMEYQKAQRAFAWKVFASPGFRWKIMKTDDLLIKDVADLDPRVQGVLDTLEQMRGLIAQTYAVVESRLHEPPHRLYLDDRQFNPQKLFKTMATLFAQIAEELAGNDILVLTDTDAIKDVDDELKAQLWSKKKRTMPNGQEQEGSDRQRKRSRVSSASVAGPSASGSVASGSGASSSRQSSSSAPPGSSASSAGPSSTRPNTTPKAKGKGKRRQR